MFQQSPLNAFFDQPTLDSKALCFGSTCDRAKNICYYNAQIALVGAAGLLFA